MKSTCILGTVWSIFFKKQLCWFFHTNSDTVYPQRWHIVYDDRHINNQLEYSQLLVGWGRLLNILGIVLRDNTIRVILIANSWRLLAWTLKWSSTTARRVTSHMSTAETTLNWPTLNNKLRVQSPQPIMIEGPSLLFMELSQVWGLRYSMRGIEWELLRIQWMHQ